MVDEFFASLSCFFNLLFFAGLGLIFWWTRRRVKEMQRRLTTVESELARLRLTPPLAHNPLMASVAPVVDDTTTAAPAPLTISRSPPSR